ncbi:FAD-dependent oxidoreductase [Rhodococcus sp. CX]|uniref:FAD-dependent oxidoreductase n=1 Tax=Rhodococcus sp. CX TaxID=2789880 RepID=UPI0018CC9D3A|nr:FAD-dependent oxidoreductase [Rhodococcus sp. CX]MBH0119944.1 FAD-dependent oxidoreductase [Rhodococcus sp. CX]
MQDNDIPETYDVVVLGSGAAGLCAALSAARAGATVAVFEKGELLGGTTCLSSAVAWLPNNRYAAEAGIEDSREHALAYLESLSNGMILPELAQAFVDTVPELLDWLGTTPLKMQLVPGYPDYHPERPGGMPGGGRSLEPGLFSFIDLGRWQDKLVGVPRRMTVGETPIGGGTGHLPPEVLAGREREDVEGLGRGMIAALLQGCLDDGVAVYTAERGVRLLRGEQGRISGVTFEGPDGTHDVHARRGVVLATGGFEWDEDLCRDFLRGPLRHPATVPTSTGDGLRMAMRVGAQLGNMREAWWAPVAVLPGQQANGVQAVQLVHRERTAPHSIMVNRLGRRFTNEATNYNALGGAFHQLDAHEFDYLNQPCWLIFDADHLDKYGAFGAAPGTEAPEWVIRADTPAELARLIDVPAGALEATLARWNEDVARGRDTEFRRGESIYDGFVGDKSEYPGVGSTLGPVARAPFYAVQIHSSTLGTKGGPRTDADGAVLDVDNCVIPGLFAAGNVMAAPTGMVYGGAGGTLGPALVFGYRAGRAAARGADHPLGSSSDSADGAMEPASA